MANKWQVFWSSPKKLHYTCHWDWTSNSCLVSMLARNYLIKEESVSCLVLDTEDTLESFRRWVMQKLKGVIQVYVTREYKLAMFFHQYWQSARLFPYLAVSGYDYWLWCSCNQEGRVAGGIGAIAGFDWWPIKAYRPCGKAAQAGVLYTR